MEIPIGHSEELNKWLAPVLKEAQPEWAASVRVTEALGFLGFNVAGDLEETPLRWVKALREMTSGYGDDPATILSKQFDQPAADELVILRDIHFVSLCEHHLLPFTGVAHVAYLPSKSVVGLSKLARLVDCFAKRLQVQERMTLEVARAIQKHLDTETVGCVVEAHHSCMGCRGVQKPGASMVTSALFGLLRTDRSMRSEFLHLIRS